MIIQRVTTLAKTAERAHLLYAPKPMQSLVTQGCIESGKDTMNSGAIYNCGPGLETTGIADLADSLMAIKKFVYDDKVITMDELIHAVETDFAEDESLRMRLKNGAPKYGNDEDVYKRQVLTLMICAARPRTRLFPVMHIIFKSKVSMLVRGVSYGISFEKIY